MMSMKAIDDSVATVRPPAKLNLFLELRQRRDDGYHEIDTVMVPIDWCDQLLLSRTRRAGIDLAVDWLPSDRILQNRLGVLAEEMIVPVDDRNLVFKALERFTSAFDVPGGFRCQLRKSIPAGAGMGGASSDAAAALRAAAALCGVSTSHPEIRDIADSIGSDVGFFLGVGGGRIAAARATGRGERLESAEMRSPLHIVVVFPNESLSTARVYGASRVPGSPASAERLVDALNTGNRAAIGAEMVNRLSDPAQEIAPRIDEILKSMWRAGLRTCQLTGSGSACFALANGARDAKRACAVLRARLQPGSFVRATRTIYGPPYVIMS